MGYEYAITERHESQAPIKPNYSMCQSFKAARQYLGAYRRQARLSGRSFEFDLWRREPGGEWERVEE